MASVMADAPRVTNNWKKGDRKPTGPGSVTSGFLGDCFPFTIGAIVTLFINSFNLISDWLAYQNLRRSNVTHYIPENMTNASVRTFYATITPLLFGLCIVAAILFGLHLTWCSYMFCMRRRMFFEKRDGVPYSMSFVEQFGGEILTLLQCLLQDLPISVLYLLLQISICCDLLFTLSHFIYAVSFAATTLSASVKFVQVIWRSGCFGQRYEYNNRCSLQVIRFVTLFCFLPVLVASSLNLTLLTHSKVPQSFLSSHVFDKVGIDQWIADDHIILYEHTISPDDRNNDNSKESELNETVEETPLLALRDIISKESETVTIMQQCCAREPHPAWFNEIEQSGHTQLVNCSLVFQFQYQASELTVYYHFGHKCYDTSGTCVSHFHDSDQAQQRLQIRTARTTKPTVERNYIKLSDKQSNKWVKCPTLQLVRNETLLDFNPCSFAPVDQ